MKVKETLMLVLIAVSVTAGVAKATPIVIDNADGFMTTGVGDGGVWTTAENAGFNNYFWYCSSGDSDAWTQWVFTNLAAGTYDVYLTWTAYSIRSDAVEFTELDQGDGVFGSINQQVAPAADIVISDWIGPKNFGKIGTVTVYNEGGNLRIFGKDVDLAADQNWIADAMAIELVPEPATMSLLGIGGLLALARRRKVSR